MHPQLPSTRNKAHRYRGKHSSQGVALVLTMILMLLIAVLALAFFSRAQSNRQISFSSSSNLRVDLLTSSAVETVVGDLLHEIEAGSIPDPLAAQDPALKRKVFQPRLVETTGTSVAPSMTLQRVVKNPATAPQTLVKQSLLNHPFFTLSDGYSNPSNRGAIPNRASSANTSTPALSGRVISTQRWNKPQFATPDTALESPDWIYLDREAKNPTTFSPALANRNAANTQYVIGRYAYNIYDVGGLIDINTVGNALSGTSNAIRGRLHQVSLADATGSLNIPQFQKFIEWRSSGEPVNPDASGGLFDPQRTFLKIPNSSQTFVNRQDLLRYSDDADLIPKAALPFLTTFSRSVNAPSYIPDPARPKLPASPAPDELNPSLTANRFTVETTLLRGSDPDVTVPAGTPVVARRFPLSKLALLSDLNANSNDLLYYFGLKKTSDHSYEYTAGIPDGGGFRIARLSEVAALGREPNFFELLQASIITGSLGKNSGNSYTIDFPRDSLRNLQIVQIAANLMDQWDSDDIPTTIQFPDNSGGYLECHGIENLPYLNNFALIPHRPSWEPDRFQLWAVFDVWNPHLNAATPTGIQKFRLLPLSGEGVVSLKYSVNVKKGGVNETPYSEFFHATAPPLAPIATTEYQSVTTLNPDGLEFSPDTYAEPTIISGSSAPTTSNTRPGILFWEKPNIPPAIPAKGNRTADLQTKLNVFMDNEFPYEAKNASGNNVAPTTDSDTGDRLYPSDTIISLNDKYWTKEQQTPTSQIRVYANHPVKAHNYYHYTISADPLKKVTIALQYQDTSGAWHTYQRLDRFMPITSDPSTANTALAGQFKNIPALTGSEKADSYIRDRPNPKPDPNWWRSTHHSMPEYNPKEYFYGWRTPYWMQSFVKFDPRTTRFGYYANEYADALGTTIRTSSTNPPSPFELSDSMKGNANWRILIGKGPGMYNGAVSPYTAFGASGFSWLDLGSGHYTAYALMINAPEGSLSAASGNLGRYADLDGIIRPADGYLGAMPTGPGRTQERPVILNRPFRSVGEMGYAFRDLPWKTLDFFSPNSGDLGLLDAFSINETPEDPPVHAGSVNLNTASKEVLETLLVGAARHPSIAGAELSGTDATPLVTALTNARNTAPFRDRGDWVRRALGPALAGTGSFTPSNVEDWKRTKIAAETAVRTTGEIGSVRTWNLLVDMIAQTGRFTPGSKSVNDFVVEAERRVWVHLAIDRLTGEVVAKEEELVYE